MNKEKDYCSQASYLAFEEIKNFSKIDTDYNNKVSPLKKFYKYDTTISEFGKIFRDKSRDRTDRALLSHEILYQYKKINLLTSRRKSLIHKLAEDKTYTIITAHQPVLFTGPLYVIYKAISAINLARQVRENYPDYHIQPIFLIGGEDHDFEEISKATVYGNRLKWSTESEGPVGRLDNTSMYCLLKELEQILGDSSNAKKYFTLFQNAYQDQENFAEATQALLIELFDDSDILVVHTDSKNLKKSFIPFIEKEILKNYSEKYVKKSQEDIEELGYTPQAYVRPINFFYIPEANSSRPLSGRFRIEKVENRYVILNTDIEFSVEEMVEEINNHPERFSPNVVMRPIYQEFLFPNLAYVGGGGELAYWLERKTQFESLDINFPMLVRRDSVIIVDDITASQLETLALEVKNFDEREDVLIKQYATELEPQHTSLKNHREVIRREFEQLSEHSSELDTTLKPYIKSQEKHIEKIIDRIEHKLTQASKRKHDVQIKRISKIKTQLFPGENLQERTTNVLDFAVRYDKVFFSSLYKYLNPLDNRLKVISFKKC